jgi:hypothetical protein
LCGRSAAGLQVVRIYMEFIWRKRGHGTIFLPGFRVRDAHSICFEAWFSSDNR